MLRRPAASLAWSTGIVVLNKMTSKCVLFTNTLVWASIPTCFSPAGHADEDSLSLSRRTWWVSSAACSVGFDGQYANFSAHSHPFNLLHYPLQVMGFQELCLLCYGILGVRHSGVSRVALISTLIKEVFVCFDVGNFQIWILSPKKCTDRFGVALRSFCSTFCVLYRNLNIATKPRFLP